MTNTTTNLERRIGWADKCGQALIDAGERRRAAVYAKISNDARAELARLTEAKS